MMQDYNLKTTLHILDEINIKFDNLDVTTRRKMVSAVEYYIPNAKFMPAYQLGRWNGKVSYCSIGGNTYLNLLPKLLPIVCDAGYDVDIEDHRHPYEFVFEEVDEDYFSYVKWGAGHAKAGESLKLRDQQVSAINTLLSNTQSVGVLATGMGKTLITATLSKQVEKYGRSIVIVPSVDLVLQTEKDYKLVGLDVGVFYGDRKDYGKTHTICTWQSLHALDKKSKTYDESITLEDFTEGVVAIIGDECHKLSADVLKQMLSVNFGHIPIRWGLTGTIPEAAHAETLLYCLIGDVSTTYRAKDLQDDKILANLHINGLQLQDPVLKFSSYQDELKWLTTDDKRLKAIAAHIIQNSEDKNSFVLVDRIECGEKLAALIPGAVFVNGSTKTKDRKKQYEEIDCSKNSVTVATFGIASTGVSVNNINNLYLYEPGKSFVRVIQSIGRGLRISKDKDFVNVYDITATTKYSKRHYTKRKQFYKDAEYPFATTKLTY